MGNQLKIENVHVPSKRLQYMRKPRKVKLRKKGTEHLISIEQHKLSPRGEAVKAMLENERKHIIQHQEEIDEKFNSLFELLKK
ncbi:hypothetical protein [Bacillus sp. FJAT-27251]|uniref:hypothetical protein n=1 Tax=Bacillus sp. FJAT-27251 TaxID=1684142 RepID=UPI0006A7ADF4|nr:hypothetical protein [Bacillus sp. FJAT-27251]